MKILLVRMGALGDIVHALPAQQWLSRHLPHAEIHWLSEPHYAPLLRCVPGIHKVWEADTKRWRRGPSLGEIARLVRQLRRMRFQVALDFQGLFKSALLTWLAGPQRLVGFKPERFKERGIDWFYGTSIGGEADFSRHVIETNLRLAQEATGRPAAASPQVDFAIPEEDRDYVHRQLRVWGLESEAPILINPGAGWETKLWPAAHYGQLSLEIEQQLGIPTLFSYGPGEEPIIDQIRKVRGRHPTRTFDSSLVQLVAICRASRLMIAGDSGPMHLAVSQSTPVVAILGPTDACRNGPANADDEVVKRQLPCSNSYKRQCNAFICMDIPIERVLDATRRRLEKISKPQPLELPILS